MKRLQKLIHKKIPQIILLAIADVFSIVITTFLTLWLRFDFDSIPQIFLNYTIQLLPFIIIITIAIFYLFNLYTSIWRYASIIELLSIIFACIISEIISFTICQFTSIKLFFSFFPIHALLLIGITCVIRFSYRILRAIIMISQHKINPKIRTLLIGAGEAGRIVVNESLRNINFKYKIVCIIDDNKKLKNIRFSGIPIIGGRHNIKDAVEKYRIDEIIIAMPSIEKSVLSKIITECQQTDCKIKIVPSILKEMSEEKITENLTTAIRPISYEDFLGRDQIVVNLSEISSNLSGQTILVTGGGGSIGSELCRQIAKCHPKKLIIFDIYENNAYDIQQELYRNFPDLDFATIIGSVRDYPRLEKVFIEFQPTQVFHAAAHKHVPLMEVSPNEAIKNNCLGTLNTVKLANKYKVQKFVLISSDKAVRPTNIMGASKRICEMIIQTYDKISNTDYVAVRFGNVLGSNGSVIPLFLKQIDAGGPVTVTDKEITRFFMTIPEAVSLILQASVYAKGGEIFVLDMGKPIKIYDLAKQIIRYKGLKPDVDIKIKITGLRPGEKLYEEILMDEEGLKTTPNKLIHIGKPIDIQSNFLKELDSLITLSQKNSPQIKSAAADIVKTYKSNNNR